MSASVAPVTRLEVERIEPPALEGLSFTGTGRYERLRGTAHGEMSADPRNSIVVHHAL